MKVVTVIYWLDVLLLCTPVIWLLVKFGMRWAASPEDLGCALLKQKAAALGVDVNRIPDPAWHAIVDMSIASAKDRVWWAGREVHETPPYWKANWAGVWEEEAQEF